MVPSSITAKTYDNRRITSLLTTKTYDAAPSFPGQASWRVLSSRSPVKSCITDMSTFCPAPAAQIHNGYEQYGIMSGGCRFSACGAPAPSRKRSVRLRPSGVRLRTSSVRHGPGLSCSCSASTRGRLVKGINDHFLIIDPSLATLVCARQTLGGKMSPQVD